MDLAEAALGRLTAAAVRADAIDRGGGRRLRWVEGGAAGPPLVLVSGAGESLLTWAPVFGELVARRRTVAYDRAGLGGSDPLWPVTGPAEVDDLAALLDAVGPAVVVGHSWGGLLAQLAAYARPGQVAGLVLVDPTHEDVFAAVPLSLRVMSGAMMRGMSALHRFGLAGRTLRSMGRQLASRTTGEPAAREAIARAYAAAYRRRSQFRMIAAENRIADRCGPWVRPLRARSTLPDVPVEVLSAGQKPAVLRDRAAALHEALADAAPCGRFTMVDDAGHYIHHQRPDAVLAAVDRVIAGSP
jgi:pimeloyl-ACP methyl ester carboxylesterase